jgi:septum formation protein
VLVLASKSPRRREILTSAGIEFRVYSADVPEVRGPAESAADYVLRLGRAKAGVVELAAGDVALGADTVVVVDEHILEKPLDDGDARRMLLLLSGRTHLVTTGICLRSQTREIADVATTSVQFAQLSEAEIDAYVRSGEPRDKAGAYAIQGLASKFISRIEGCYSNVVGLPIALVYRHLRTFGPRL